MKALVLVAALINLITAPPLHAEERVSHGSFQDVTLYRPKGEVRAFVLFLSGDGGWNLGVKDMALALVDQGAMVAGIDLPRFFANLEMDTGDCVLPDADLENLSHYLQGYASLPTYYTPLLVGYSSGATLAYAMIAQAPTGTFSGAISLGFCPDLEISKPLCKGEDVHFTKRRGSKGVDLLPAARLRVPWVALQGEQDQVCDAKATQKFVSQVPAGNIVMLPKVGHGYSVTRNWMPQYLVAYRSLTARRAAIEPPPPATLADLPIVEVPTDTQGDTFAVMLSGDGGWAGLDVDVAAALAAKGIPVAGFNSLRYFWAPRTPLAVGNDLDRVLRYYTAHWKKSHALLIGYSQGANVLPFAYNRLPASSKSLVSQIVMIGLGPTASFEFHLGNWVGGDQGGEPVLPEVEKLEAATTLCLYGQDENDSLCPAIPSAHIRARALPGGHHFNGDYDKLAESILSVAKAP
jgi:type IV secretory pathway VirJ component